MLNYLNSLSAVRGRQVVFAANALVWVLIIAGVYFITH